MPTSLGLCGDLDDVALIEDVEDAFGFRLPDDEAGLCRTVGDLFALVEARLPDNTSAGRCATAMTFYRLRRALQPATTIVLRPDTPVTALEPIPLKELQRIIRQECGLRPPTGRLVLWGQFALLGAVVAPFLAIVLPWWLAAAAFFLACAIFRFAPHELPDTMTFGDLVREVSTRNVGTLARQGARLRASEAWDAFRNIMADHTLLPKDLIERDTLLLDPEVAAA